VHIFYSFIRKYRHFFFLFYEAPPYDNPMENLIVVSKVKKYIKEKHQLSTSSSFFEALNKDVATAVNEAIASAQSNKRKTVMGRDLNFFVADAKIEQNLIVGSKTKAFIKAESGLSTSKQLLEQLSYRVEKLCSLAADNCKSSKRKTVMDRDYSPIQSIL